MCISRRMDTLVGCLYPSAGLSFTLVVGAERGGFEPPRPVSQSNGLANRRYRPLSHLSLIAARRPDRGAKFASREVTKSATASSTARRAVRRRTRDASCKWPDLQL